MTASFTQIAGVIPTGSEVADTLAIQAVIYHHCRGLDRLDSNTLKTCYWPEAAVDYGNYKGAAELFCDLVVTALADNYALTQHSVSNTLIELRGNTALSESYVTARHLLLDANAEMVFSGRYLDRLERREQGWKIIHRQVVMDWIRQQPVTDERNSVAFVALAKGAHRDQDPLHAFLTAE